MEPYAPLPPPRAGTPVWVWLLAGCGGVGCLGVCAAVYLAFFVGKTAMEAINQAYVDMRSASSVLKVQDQKLVTYEGHKFIVGTIKNTSPSDSYDFASISFHIYDKLGADIETVEDSTEEVLKPGQIWRFKAAVTNAAAVRAAIDETLGSKVDPDEEKLSPEEKARRDKILADTKEKIRKIVDEAKERDRN